MKLGADPEVQPETPLERLKRRLDELVARDPEVALAVGSPEGNERMHAPDASLYETINAALSAYAGRPALGERAWELSTDESTGRRVRRYRNAFESIDYADLHRRVQALALAWRQHPDHRVGRDEFVCILGFASIDFAVLDLACSYAQAVTVPLQSSTSGADLGEIFANVEPVTLAATLEDLETAVDHALRSRSIRSLIVFDFDSRVDDERERFDAARERLSESGSAVQLIKLDELIAAASADDWSPLPAHPDGPERMAAIIHSSGSTGTPKGAIVPEKALRAHWPSRLSSVPFITVIFGPLNHLLGRGTLTAALRQGGQGYFTLRPDMSTLLEDIRLVRPTFLICFPRFFDQIYQHYLNELTRRSGEGPRDEVARRIRAEMFAGYLGDRLLAGSVGGAPTQPEVRKFMRDTFEMLLNDGYGSTESGNGIVTLNDRIQRPPIIEYRLRDVPELGYYTTDRPYPRGELCFKSEFAITRYYKQPDATQGLMDDEGFILTGDIVEERGPDHVVIIDRRKDVLKLAQGEYVAVGRLGTRIEAASALIEQIYVYGSSVQAYLLAVVVPDLAVARAELGCEPDEADLRTLVRDEFQRLGRELELRSFEVPRDFIIEREPFSQENGLLSSVRKRLRPALARRYGESLEALYAHHSEAELEARAALSDPDSGLSVEQRLRRLLALRLHAPESEIDPGLSFGELGGDSLAAVTVAADICSAFDVEIGADLILSPTGSINHWAELIEQQSDPRRARPTLSSLHGPAPARIDVRDLALERIIGETACEAARSAQAPDGPARTVLLTGANGFLGHIVALEWLARLAPVGGKLVCLVRGRDADAARRRLDAAFEGQDERLQARYAELSAGHLEVLPGDMSEPGLGLTEANFDRLANKVDRIVHVGALVNHRLGYAHLFGPNVLGTAELVRLALAKRLKPVDFVSSEAVLPLLQKSAAIDEDTPLSDSIPLLEHYAAGYGASKWAGEQILRQASATFGLPVNIFRGDMMLAHREFRGQINAQDMFTRLLSSIVLTGLAPASFYEPGAIGHYDGTPVDVVASAIVGVADQPPEGCQTYHVSNDHHDDGASLDAFVDWVAEAGFPVTRIDDHGDWLHRFEDRLHDLPEKRRQQSALEILGAFARPMPGARAPAACHRYKALLQEIGIGRAPSLDAGFIRKCLDDMQALGLIESPPARA